MSKICCIYKITNILNGKIYVGSAIDFVSRRYKHLHKLRKNKHENRKLQNAYNKYGEKNFNFDILEEVSDSKYLISVEQIFIDLLNPFYNICKIASSRLGVKATDETKEKQRLAKLNQTEETRNQISNTLKSKGIKKTQSEKDNISAKLKGRKNTEEHNFNIKKGLIEYCKNRTDSHKYNLLKAHLGNKHFSGKIVTENHKNKISSKNKELWIERKLYGINGKKINQFDLNGTFIKTWNYIIDAARELKIKSSGISATCRGKYKSSGGFIWKYESYKGLVEFNSTNKRYKPILQYDLNNNLIREWDSAKSASISLNINSSPITRVCKNKLKTYKGFVWIYKK